MSLLMEALKKAELAKRAASEPAPTVAAMPPASSAPLTLELAPTEPRPVKPEVPETNPVVEAASGREPSLPGEKTDSSRPDAAPTTTTVREESARVVQMPTAPTVTAPEPPKVSQPAPDPRPAPTEPAIASPRVPSPARQHRLKSERVRMAGYAALIVVMLVGGGIAYYKAVATTSQNTNPFIPPPVAVSPAPEAAVSTPPPESEPPKKAVTRKSARAPQPATVAAPAPTSSAEIPAAAPAVTAVDPVTAPPAPEPTPAVPAPLAVARDAGRDNVYSNLQQAYAAYQSGDDTRAQVLYARVLSDDQHNRDALLGLAALSIRQRDFARAQTIYSELLTLDPKDSVAQAGFVSVTSSLDPVVQEARLKTLLEQEPGAPHLLFAYAGILMQQQRWSESARALLTAQQVRRDHPDTAYNLAVSLDHLGQGTGAVQNYKLALDLAQRVPSVFKLEDARRRIAALQAQGEGARQ